MHAPDGERGPVRSQRSLDSSILKYLRRMIAYCRNSNHRDARQEYESAWEFAAAKIYGPLPPRPVYNLRGISEPTELLAGEESPESVASHLPPGTIRPARPWPLQKIKKKFARRWRGSEYHYETLQCDHILLAPCGYSVPVKARRCIHCAAAAQEKAASRKKPAARAGQQTRSKAVGA